MPIIRERDPDVVYSREERESSWAAVLLVILLMTVLGVFAFLLLAHDNDRQRMMDQLNDLRIQQQVPPVQTVPPISQPITIPVPQPYPVPVTKPVPVPVPTPMPRVDSGANSNRNSGTNSGGSTSSPPVERSNSAGTGVDSAEGTGDTGEATTP